MKTTILTIFFAFCTAIFAATDYEFQHKFSFPVDPYEDHSFSDGGFGTGFVSPRTGNTVYHMAEDWHRKTSTTFGRKVYAIADGVVTMVKELDGTAPDDFNTEIHVEHTLPNGIKIEAVYNHLSKALYKEGWKCDRGDAIGEIGDGNGKWPTHLHFEIRKAGIGKTRKNPYASLLNKLEPSSSSYSSARDYFCPSLLISDFAKEKVIFLTDRSVTWDYFIVDDFARFSTAYVVYRGKNYSLTQAFQKGYVSVVYFQDSKNKSIWIPDTGRTRHFRPNVEYRIRAKKDGIELHIPICLNYGGFDDSEENGKSQRKLVMESYARVDLINFLNAYNSLYHLEPDPIKDMAKNNPQWYVNKYRYYRSKKDYDDGESYEVIIAQYKKTPIIRFIHPNGELNEKRVFVNPNISQ